MLIAYEVIRNVETAWTSYWPGTAPTGPASEQKGNLVLKIWPGMGEEKWQGEETWQMYLQTKQNKKTDLNLMTWFYNTVGVYF